MFHFQKTVPDWPRAVVILPPKSSVKSVDRGDILRDAKKFKPGIHTAFRHWNDGMQAFTGKESSGWFDWATAKALARQWFDTHIDETFVNNYAMWVDSVSWYNEIWANSQNVIEINERIESTRAALTVWNTEYRPFLQRESGNDIKLIVGEAAVGNHMPREVALASITEDSLLGYHPYTWWGNDNGYYFRAANDWVDLSGRWERMELEWGLRPTWIFTECGPFEAAESGWKHSRCLNGSIDRYIQAMREWLWDVQDTAAYKEGRIVGFHMFTTGGEGAWTTFDTKQPEMDRLAQMFVEEWNPGEVTLPPPPEEPPVEVNYVVVVHLFPQDTSREEVNKALDVRTVSPPGTAPKSAFERRQSFLFSADDAARMVAPGKPGSKVIVWNAERWTGGDIADWLEERGVQIVEHARF